MATYNEDVTINGANLHVNFGPTGSVNSGTPLGNGPGWIFLAPNGHRRDIVAWIGGLCIGASGDSGPSYGAGFNVMEDGRVGIGTESPQATLHVNGDILASGDIAIRNADCAEEFAVADKNACDPGTVMVLGEDGLLRESTEPYDRKVAGVISGAGAYKPGLILDRQDKPNRIAVAMLGKVVCKVDADSAPVGIGDLLTTSATPGHAMKATDQTRAFGTVIGKALKPLSEGRGLIPILVALQ